jgi:hypothetical protein
MELQQRPYTKLLLKMKDYFIKERNAEMVAMITAAQYEHMTLVKICSSKLLQQLPAVASEAITTVDEIAGKVLPNVEKNNDN